MWVPMIVAGDRADRVVRALVLLCVAVPVDRAAGDRAVGLLDRLRLDVLVHHLVLRVNQRLVLYPLNGTVGNRLVGQPIAGAGVCNAGFVVILATFWLPTLFRVRHPGNRVVSSSPSDSSPSKP